MLSVLLCTWVIQNQEHSATSLKCNRTGSITCNRSRCHHMLSWAEIVRAVLILLPAGKSMQLIRVGMSTVTALCSAHHCYSTVWGNTGYTLTQISVPPICPHTTAGLLAASCPSTPPYSFCKCSCELWPLDFNTCSQHLTFESILPTRIDN